MKKTFGLILLAVLVSLAPAHAQNLLTNDSFETGTTQQYGSGVIPGWTTWGTSGFQEQDFAHTGTFSVKSWWDDTGIYQDFAATAGLSYDVSAFGYNPSTDAAIGKDGELRIEWFDATFSTQVGSTSVGKFFGDAVDPLNTWKLISGTVVAPVGAANGRLVLQTVANANPMQGGVIGWDDASVSLAAVPELSSIAMMGIGLVGLVGAVRRFRK